MKSENYDTKKLVTATYLLDSRFSKSERELLFKLRSKTLKVKSNFRNGNQENMFCDLCNLFRCTQEHPLSCPVLTQKCRILDTAEIKHSNIYGSVDQQLTYTKIYSEFWNTRQDILDLQGSND